MVRRKYCLGRYQGTKNLLDIPSCEICCLYCKTCKNDHNGKLCGIDACKFDEEECVSDKELLGKRKRCSQRGTRYMMKWRQILG